MTQEIPRQSQWLGLGDFTAWVWGCVCAGPGSIPGQGNKIL